MSDDTERTPKAWLAASRSGLASLRALRPAAPAAPPQAAPSPAASQTPRISWLYLNSTVDLYGSTYRGKF